MSDSSARADCIFCKIAAGEIPCAKLYEDEDCLAFMDINPLAEGHVLIIPKKHAETLYEMSPAEVCACTKLLGRLGRAVQSAVGAEGLNVLQKNGRCSGQAVMHVHFHLIPRVPGDALGYRWPAGQYPEGRLEEVHGMIVQAFGDD